MTDWKWPSHFKENLLSFVESDIYSSLKLNREPAWEEAHLLAFRVTWMCNVWPSLTGRLTAETFQRRKQCILHENKTKQKNLEEMRRIYLRNNWSLSMARWEITCEDRRSSSISKSEPNSTSTSETCGLKIKELFDTFQTLKRFYETRHGGIYIPRTWETDKENYKFGNSPS